MSREQDLIKQLENSLETEIVGVVSAGAVGGSGSGSIMVSGNLKDGPNDAGIHG